MKKSLKRIAILLVIALLAPLVLPCVPMMKGLTSSEAEAAAKGASVNINKTTIGIYSSPQFLDINNEKSGAKYTVTPKDKKIATINKYGEIIGVSIGKTTVTVTEKYKGKTKTVGKIAVTVVGPKFDYNEITMGVNDRRSLPIIYYNQKAKYTIKSSDSSIVSIDENGLARGVKWGTAEVSVTESYKGITTDLGSMKFTVMPASVRDDAEFTINLNDDSSMSSLIDDIGLDYYNESATYTAVSADPSIVACGTKTDSDGQAYDALSGLKTGSTTLTIYEEFDGVKNEIGKVAVKVVEVPVESFDLYDDLDEVDGLPTIEYYLDDSESGYSNIEDLFDVEPYETTSPITYVSSSDKIVKVDSQGNVTPVAEGTSKFTVSCGCFSLVIQIIVNSTEDSGYDFEEDL